jgi:hypothetical protein
VLNIQGYDFFGNALSNVTASINVNTAVRPQDFIAINEIMYNPPVPEASYVELYNRSLNTAFDLSGLQLDPLQFTFPPNSMIAPGQALALVKNPAVFTATYGSLTPIAGVFAGDLSPSAMTLTLLNPGPGHSPDVIIDRVRYENAAPWPAAANGSALQLIDAAQDNARVSNWSDGSSWRYFVNTNLKISTSIDLWLTTSNSDLYIDNLSVVIGSTPEVGTNLVQNGGFEAGTNGFRFIGTHTNSSIATDLKLTGSNSLHIASGSSVGSAVSRITQNLTGTIATTNYTLSFWYLATTNSSGLTFRFGSATNFVVNVTRGTGRSPAALNTVAAVLPPYPTLWLNEMQAENITGILDGHGEHEPWIELYNGGTNAVSLNGLFLANNYENLTQWGFPSNAVLASGEFKVVFADAQPEQSTDTEWHTNFRLSGGVGRVALSRLAGAVPQIVDYINYTNLAPGHSFGAFPDGQAFTPRQDFFYVTPGGTNDATLAPIQVYINEWMASNTRSLTNAANGNKLDDWFEIYNPGTNVVSLAGYYLTDSLTNKTQFLIPQGYSIQPHGFLLVWADGKPNLNSPLRPELHVNFSLDKGGEAIGLFLPDGTAVDAVVFGPQTSDVTQGRFPDGSGPVYVTVAPTPGAPNLVAPNQPPVLGLVPDVTMDPGEYIYFPVNASDSQVPPQVLAFTLLQGPTGATLDSASGLFSYTAYAGTYSASNLVVFQVTDNGFPSLSATQSFRIFVRPGNTPPVLSPIASRAIHAGASVIITNIATDADVPANALTFTLDPGAPPGAILDAITGVFLWSTTTNQPPGTNLFTVRVTDDGIPSMSAAQSFNIVVIEPLRVRSIVRQSDGKLTLTWSAIPGQKYQVEYKNDLNDAAWSPTGAAQTAISDTLTFEFMPGDQAGGFYSLRLVE